MSPDVLIQEFLAGGVLGLKLNRPEKRNALNRELRHRLVDALAYAAREPSVKVLVLSASGPAFSAGADLAELSAASDQDLQQARAAYELILVGLRQMPKPTLAALPGPAAGIGLSLALACDLRYASTQARLIPGFVNLALMPDGGLTWILPRLVGSGRAYELLYTGRELDADEALGWGLVNRVLAPPDLDAEIAALAGRLSSGPQAVLGAIKRSILHASEVPWEEALDFEFLLQSVQLSGPEFKSSAQALAARFVHPPASG